jgi:hypothetical protein
VAATANPATVEPAPIRARRLSAWVAMSRKYDVSVVFGAVNAQASPQRRWQVTGLRLPWVWPAMGSSVRGRRVRSDMTGPSEWADEVWVLVPRWAECQPSVRSLREVNRPVKTLGQSCSITQSMQVVSAAMSEGSIAGYIAMRSWLRPSLR